MKHQVLLGRAPARARPSPWQTSSKTPTVPALVIAHNKTLAAQLAAEFREFFPENAVGYFVSYYDYYQPEAYIPSTDTFIEKDSCVNDEIDRMRHSATAWLSERRDVVIVASVSCIYGLGDPEEYESLSVSLREGMTIDRDELLRRLVEMQYTRNDFESGARHLPRARRRRGDHPRRVAAKKPCAWRCSAMKSIASPKWKSSPGSAPVH